MNIRIAVVAAALILTLCGCAPAGPPATETVAAEPWFDGLVEVADRRELNATCYGEGSPAVIYLHGAMQPDDEIRWAHSAEMRGRLATDTIYCEYERTNVGESSDAPGPIPVTESVADLHALIQGLELETPVVLLGGSFGGLIAYSYAGTHPADVAGVVMLDPTLPDEPALDAMLPEEWRMTPDAWQDNAEQIDSYGSYAIAQAAVGTIPDVPGTIFVTEELWAPDGENAEAFRQTVRDQQAALAAHFDPGEIITVDAPHAMIPVVPDEIAAAVLDMVR